jgi:formate hydrogenlyase transcriptional activator
MAWTFPPANPISGWGLVVPIEGTPGGLAFTSRKPVLRERPDPNEFPSELMQRAMVIGVKSGCIVPLICHDQVLGTLAIASFREAAFSEQDSELLNQIGVQVAIAVQNALNYAQLRDVELAVARERDRSKLLLEINNALVSHLDLHELVKLISLKLPKERDCQRAHIEGATRAPAVANALDPEGSAAA